MQNASELITVVDADTRVVYATDAVVPLLGYDADDLRGHLLVDFAHPDDAGALREAAAGAPMSTIECRLRARDESWVVLEWTRGSLPDGGCILTGRDITDRKRLEGELRHMAFHDTLTGLAEPRPVRGSAHARAASATRGRGGGWPSSSSTWTTSRP